jgi:ribosomal protein L30E
LILIGVFAAGDANNLDIIVFIYGLFSKTVSAYNPSLDINFQIFSVFVPIIGTVFFSGILVSTITNSILCRVDDYKKGKIHYKHLKGHNIIIGANEILPAIVNSYKREKGKIIIVSEKSPNDIKKMLYNVNGNIINDKIIIYNGHPLNPDVLR